MNNSVYQNVYTHLERIVAMPTVSGEEIPADEIIMYASTVLENAGMHVRTYKDQGYPSLVATSQPDSKTPDLLLLAHLDVVAAKQDQFTLQRKDGKLYGRGVLDMKFAAACFLETAISLKDKMRDYDFGIMFTTDEEVGGMNGAKFLLEQGYRANVCLLPDGANNWQVEGRAQGGWHLRANAIGTTAHGSRPWEGDSASDKIIDFIQEARAIVPRTEKHVDTTMTVSVLQAGKAINQVPDFASAGFDIRFLKKATISDLRQRFNAAAARCDVTLETTSYMAPVELDLALPQLHDWETIVKKVRGKVSKEYALSFAASDARFFAEYDIPVIVTYPEGHGHHSDDEWISEEGLYQFYECTLAYVKAIAGN